jgi:hypothetical protein
MAAPYFFRLQDPVTSNVLSFVGNSATDSLYQMVPQNAQVISNDNSIFYVVVSGANCTTSCIISGSTLAVAAGPVFSPVFLQVKTSGTPTSTMQLVPNGSQFSISVGSGGQYLQMPPATVPGVPLAASSENVVWNLVAVAPTFLLATPDGDFITGTTGTTGTTTFTTGTKDQGTVFEVLNKAVVMHSTMPNEPSNQSDVTTFGPAAYQVVTTQQSTFADLFSGLVPGSTYSVSTFVAPTETVSKNLNFWSAPSSGSLTQTTVITSALIVVPYVLSDAIGYGVYNAALSFSTTTTPWPNETSYTFTAPKAGPLSPAPNTPCPSIPTVVPCQTGGTCPTCPASGPCSGGGNGNTGNSSSASSSGTSSGKKTFVVNIMLVFVVAAALACWIAAIIYLRPNGQTAILNEKI